MLSGVKPKGPRQVLALWSWQACSLLARHDSTFCFIGNLFSWIIKDQLAAESMNSNKHEERFSFFQLVQQGCPEQTCVRNIIIGVDAVALLGQTDPTWCNWATSVVAENKNTFCLFDLGFQSVYSYCVHGSSVFGLLNCHFMWHVSISTWLQGP